MLGWSAKGCGAAAAVAAGAGADGGESAPVGFRMGPESGGLELRETRHILDSLWGKIKQCSNETSIPKHPYVGDQPGVWCWILWWI